MPNGRWETRRVLTNVNSTFVQTELPFENIPVSTGATFYTGRVRYVTGTGTVKAQTGYVVTGASKETKTKFNSEFASGWTITIGCGGATCTGASCTTDNDCMISGKTTGGTCLGYNTNSQNSKIVDGNENTRFLEQLKVGYTITSMTQTRTITAISSNLLMTVNNAFDTPGITTP